MPIERMTEAEHRAHSETALDLPQLREALVGGTIFSVNGTTGPDNRLVLGIERPRERRFVTLVFNELGMWIEPQQEG